MNDEAPPTTSDELSDGQVKVLELIQICSASLSVIGSSMIVFKIIRARVQNGSMMPYDRIILGLSTCDVLASIAYAINDFLLPSETGIVWAFGSLSTCQASGFLLQLFPFWAYWYNCILSYYFLLTVLCQVRGRGNNFVRKCEPWMHLSGIYIPIIAILGLLRGWYGLDDYDNCWITDPNIKVIVAMVPFVFVVLSLIINYIVIFAVVRKSLRSSEHVAGPTLVQKRLMREAMTLMFLYVGCVFVTFLPHTLLEMLFAYFGYSHNNEGKIYPLLVLDSMFLPLQGFFNVFIYIKPAYTRFRAANRTKSLYFVLHQALFNPKTPRLYHPNHPTSNAIAEGDSGINSDINFIFPDYNFEEVAKEEEPNLSLKRKKPRKKQRKKSEDSKDNDSLSDSS